MSEPWVPKGTAKCTSVRGVDGEKPKKLAEAWEKKKPGDIVPLADKGKRGIFWHSDPGLC